MKLLEVHLLPSLLDESRLVGSTAVIIDILRASTTITTAIHNGAAGVIPCATPDAAFRMRAEREHGNVLLGGERGGVRIAGFDCGNSPAEYTADRAAGKTIAFTTTNGTGALLKAASAKKILAGAFINRRALIDRLRRDAQPIHLVCAGTGGVITGEDVLFAGAIVDALLLAESADRAETPLWLPNDSARIAQAYWRSSMGPEAPRDGRPSLAEKIETTLRHTQGGVNLRQLGYDNDIRMCSAVDITDCVPELNHASGTLR